MTATKERLRSGELFAGVGGLGMAVDEVFGSEPAWFSEFDAAPSKVLAHHYPDVPNFGDVTKVDFRAVPHTHIRAGGFPCQDVSLAGRRRGMREGTRSGLWSEFRRSIEQDRPDWVVIENVRGLLSAGAAGDVEPCPWCLGDNGEQHALRALGAVLGDLADLGFDAEWTGLRAADVGAPHGRFRVFILAWPAERTLAHASGGRGRRGTLAPRRREGTRADAPAHGTDPRVDGEPRSAKPGREVVTDLAIIAENGLITTGGRLLPTPGAYDGDRGGSQHPDKRREGGHSVTIQDVAENLTDWGPYAAAIERWASVTSRYAPAPVRYDGKGGKPRLNPELTEWMMGWPEGWVTDPAIGLSRAEQLKACGNGVVTLQAVTALRELLSRPGVPSIRQAVAA